MNREIFLEHNKNGFVFFSDKRLDKEGVTNAFTTRFGGVSSGYFGEMNLSFTRGEARETVLKNYGILAERLNLNIEKFILTTQTHNDIVYTVDSSMCGIGITKPPFDDADALVTSEEGIVLTAFFADCVPIILYDKSKRVISVVHSGWKGTVLQIVAKAAIKMQQEFGSNPKDIIASIGPSISKDEFIIEQDVADMLATIPDAKKSIEESGTKYKADLWEINQSILINCQIPKENIEIIGICTAQNSDMFYSHRINGDLRGNFSALACL